MARSFVDELRRVVLEQLIKIGAPVANIHGAAKAPIAKITSAVPASWLVYQLPGRRYDTVDDFYRALAATPSPIQQLLAIDSGIVTAASATSEPATFLFRASITLEQARTVPLAVDVGSSTGSFQVIIDGRVVKTGVSSVETNIGLNAGQHSIEVLATSRLAGIAVPTDLPLRGDVELVPRPVWKAVTTGYRDQFIGVSAAKLQWFVDPRVGGWVVLRREQSDVATIMAVGTPDDRSQLTVQLNGDVHTSVTPGSSLYAGTELAGVVVDSRYDATAARTMVRIQLGANRTSSSQLWVGRGAATGRFVERTRIGRMDAGGFAEWTDTNVAYGDYFEYVLLAYGLFDASTVSAPSESRYVHIGDTSAPGAITFAPSYPTYYGNTVRAKFHTPSDADYAGVRVYYRKSLTGTTSSAAASTLTSVGTFTAGAQVGWTLRITAGTGVGQERKVTANTTTTLTVDNPWATTPDGTSTYLLFVDLAVLTDYGLPNTDDSLAFEPADISPTGPLQTYHFRTFDKVGHEQSELTCAVYVLDPSVTSVAVDTYDDLQITVVPGSTNATQVTVQVTATNKSGTPQVKLLAMLGSTSVLSCSVPAGATPGTLVPSGTTWTFSRPGPLTSPAQATFGSFLAGAIADADQFTIAEQGRDTVRLVVKAKVTAADATSTTVSVTATDPLGSGLTITLTVDDLGGLAGGSVTPASVSGTNTVTQSYVIPRPAAGAGTARVVFKGAATGRVDDSDSVDVVPQDVDTKNAVCVALVTGTSATQITVTVTAPLIGGLQPQVKLVALTGATLASGTALGTYVTPDGTNNVWVFNRAAFQAGLGQAQFRAHLAGTTSFPVIDDDAFVELPEQGRDTVGLVVSAQVTATSTTSVTVRVTVSDPISANGITLTQTNSGLTVAPSGAQSLAAGGGFIDYTVTRSAFGSGTGRVLFTATSTGRVQGVDAVDIPEQLRDTIMPFLRATTSESGTVGTLTLTAVDPQSRITQVEARTFEGASTTPTQDWTVLTPTGGVYTQTVNLVDKQPSRIDWRMTATPATGPAALTSEGSVRFAIGARPAVPELSYSIGADGVLEITVRGDADTNLIRIAVADSPPTEFMIDNSTNTSATRSYVYRHSPALVVGQKFYIGARAYNTNLALVDQASAKVIQTDQWLGPSSGQATVSVASITVTDKSAVFSGITFGAQTTHVDVFVREYRAGADPSSPVDVSRIGYRALGAPLLQNGSLVIPICQPSNYLFVTFQAFDALNRVAVTTATAVGVAAGTVNLKAQANAAPPATLPDAPTALTATPTGTPATSVDLAITLPPTVNAAFPATLRIYRDDAPIADVAATQTGGFVQHFTDTGRSPGATYTYYVYGMSAGGLLSTTHSPSASATIAASPTIPTPTLAVDAWAYGGQAVTITPGAGSPPDITWHLAHNTSGGGYTSAETSTSLTFTHVHPLDGTLHTHTLKVFGSKLGWANSADSNVVTAAIPATVGKGFL